MPGGLEKFEIYQLAERLEIYCHKILDRFPKKSFIAINQLRRSTSSVVDNIAEGYARYTYKEKRNKFIIARGEAMETKQGFIRAYKKDYIPKIIADRIEEKYTDLMKMINGYIRFLSKQIDQSTN